MKHVTSNILRRGFLACACLLVLARANAASEAQALLAASDAVRNPGAPFSLQMELVEYRQQQQTAVNRLEVFSKADPASGRFKSLVRFVSPARDADKLMLKDGRDLWFYDPRDKASVRISPQQRLLGQAANGDVVAANFARDYEVSLAGDDTLRDADGVERACRQLSLSARVADVTYAKITLWVEATTSHPIKGEFFTETGQRLKTVYYRRYREELGALRPTEVVIFDGLNPGWVTVMRYSDYRLRDIPDFWFQRDYLPRFRPN